VGGVGSDRVGADLAFIDGGGHAWWLAACMTLDSWA
jgi:hypothetical protein